MTIVLVIFALLAGGMMMTLSAQQENQRLTEVRRQLSDIRDALIGYTVAYGRLPPPADPTIASGTAGAGESNDNRLASPHNGLGVLPWATLGLPETDPWGQRFTYRVHPGFADAISPSTAPPSCNPASATPPPPVQASFALCSQGNINVTDGAVNIATNLPAIVVSHGRNGRSGYRSDGAQIPGAAADEAENGDNNHAFVSRTHSPDFDDELIWVPIPILMSRMIAAGRLP
jgi:type II secretory pathway pseudopilin PulG